MAKVLVTCVGSGVGQSAIDSLSMTGKHYIIGCDRIRNIYAYNKCNEFQITPGVYSDGYVESVLKICIEKGVQIVIPGHDHELLLFSRDREKFERNNIKIIVSNPDIIEISRDKLEWYRFFSSRGIPIVPTFRVGDFRKKSNLSIFPAIVKPPGGSASQGITILKDISGIEGVNDADIIQPYLFPTKEDVNYKTIHKSVMEGRFVQMSEISIQLIFNNKSEFVDIFISKNILKKGVPVFVDPIQPEEFEHLEDIMKFVPILKEYKVKGPVNIQGRVTDKGLVFFEMNMRFTGITGNRAQLGFNEVEFLVNDFLGKPGILNGYASNKLGARQVACTTIPREPDLKYKINITILGLESEIAKNFINHISTSDHVSKINAINSNLKDESLRNDYNFGNIQIYNSYDDEIEAVYCQTDILINFATIFETNNFSEQVLFIQEQLKSIMQANIPLVINVYNSEKDTFLNKIISNCFSYIHFFIPAVQFVELDVARHGINERIVEIIDNI
ncbi:MAG: hypothetical protein ACOC22_03785 [bacterium]